MTQSSRAFDRLRVLEIAGSLAGSVAAELFADVGATVTRFEPGAGADGPARLAEAVAAVDVAIESAAPGPLDPVRAEALADCPVRLRISPLGSRGPLAGLHADDFVLDALSGHLLLSGEPDREPLARPVRLASVQAGLHAFIGALAALRSRDGSRGAAIVEVSEFEGLVAIHQHTFTMWTHDRHVLRRAGNRQPGYWHPVGVYRCRDGHVVLNVTGQAARDRLLAVTERAEALLDPRFADDLAVARHKDELDRLLQPWLDARTRSEVVRELQGARVAASAVLAPSEVLHDPQLAARRALVERDGVRTPRGPIRIERAEAAEAAHDTGARHRGEAGRRRAGPQGSAPLAGVRVLELGRVWAAPLAGRMLADLGADVVAVEAPDARGGRETPDGLAEATHLFPDGDVGRDPWNRIGSLNALLRGKRAITLDLRRAEARSVFEGLVAAADVLLENTAPGLLPRLGLDFEGLSARRPGIVYTSITGFGQSGPDTDHVAFGPNVEARAGVTHATGYPDSGPYRSGVAWPDPLAALVAVAGTLTALRERDDDPRPRARRVDVSMLESALWCASDFVADAQTGAGDPPRRGARHAERAPQGVYPCAGADLWIAISVASERAWQALCEVLDLDDVWRPLDEAGRRARHDEIDAAIAERTRSEDRIALTRRLQAAGVLAGWLADARDLCESDQLAATGFWVDPPRPHDLPRREPGLPIRRDGSAGAGYRPAPRLGEHNREVLRDWLALGDPRLEELERAGVLVAAPPR